MNIFKRIAAALKAHHERVKNSQPYYEGFQPRTERPPFPTGARSVMASQADRSRKR